jgi:uncharacterized protein (DUF433 family)
MSEIDWRDYIHAHPEIVTGKPVVRGTRLSIHFLLSLLAAGWSIEDLLRSYPTLTREGLQAVFAYAADVVRDEPFVVNS